jgi:ubiquinone/menaquinone biosynthesis C-methylase UbiE
MGRCRSRARALRFEDVEVNPSIGLQEYRAHPHDVERVQRLFSLVPRKGVSALDVGARDGHLSVLLAERFERVVALDLATPAVEHPRVECVQGDAAALAYPDNAFHTIVCAEVLEHIPPALLPRVCSEIVRVASHCVVIGVPYQQDLRLACSTCRRCGTINPPWGHVNSFDESRLTALMSGLVRTEVDYVGKTRESSNALSASLFKFAGNPFGTYGQEESCIGCGQALLPPPPRNLAQRLATRVAQWALDVQAAFTPWRGNWMHMRFEKRPMPQLAGSHGAWDRPLGPALDRQGL